MGLVALAQAHWKAFSSNQTTGFGVSITLAVPVGQGSQSITIGGLHTVHHLNVDTMGNITNAKNAYIGISEDLLTGYPVRNVNGKIDLKNHRISVANSTGISQLYFIKEAWPDETVGLIVINLGDRVNA